MAWTSLMGFERLAADGVKGDPGAEIGDLLVGFEAVAIGMRDDDFALRA